eukprot:1139279-Pelagomonas_calceolata.AAC.3
MQKAACELKYTEGLKAVLQVAKEMSTIKVQGNDHHPVAQNVTIITVDICVHDDGLCDDSKRCEVLLCSIAIRSWKFRASLCMPRVVSAKIQEGWD